MARANADSYKLSYFSAGFNSLNPCLTALSVCEEIQRRVTFLFACTYCNIQRATNSPSRPASVAITISFMSFLLTRLSIVFNWLLVFGNGFVPINLGSIGNVSNCHFSHFLFKSSGIFKPSKCPKAQVIT